MNLRFAFQTFKKFLIVFHFLLKMVVIFNCSSLLLSNSNRTVSNNILTSYREKNILKRQTNSIEKYTMTKVTVSEQIVNLTSKEQSLINYRTTIIQKPCCGAPTISLKNWNTHQLTRSQEV